jgi:ribosomal protein S18 acetylase RimI-like enzyme
MMNSDIVYEKGTSKDVEDIVDISFMVFEQNRYFIFNLGKDFVLDYYRLVQENYPDHFFIAKQNKKTIGFIIGYPDSQKLTKQLLKKSFLFAYGFLVRKYRIAMNLFTFLKTSIKSIRYVSRSENGGELLSMAINTSQQGKGVGSILVGLLNESLKPHTQKCFVHTHTHLTQTVNFYLKLGFKEFSKDKMGETIVLLKKI